MPLIRLWQPVGTKNRYVSNNQQIDVSVVMPCLNEANSLGACFLLALVLLVSPVGKCSKALISSPLAVGPPMAT